MNYQSNTIQLEHPKCCESASLGIMSRREDDCLSVIDSIIGQYAFIEVSMGHYATLKFVPADLWETGDFQESDILTVSLDMICPGSEEELVAITDDADIILHALFTSIGSYSKYIH